MVTCSTLSYPSCIFESFHTERNCKDAFRHLVVLVAQSCPTFCDPMVCIPPGSFVPGILQARILEWVAISSYGDLPNPWIKPRFPTLQADSLLSEPLETSWDTSSCLFLLSVLSGTSPLSFSHSAPPCRLDILSYFLSDAMQLTWALSIWAQAHPEAHWELSFQQKF